MIRWAVGISVFVLFFGAVGQLRADFVLSSPPYYQGEESASESNNPTFFQSLGNNYNYNGSGSSSFSSGTGYNSTATDSESLSYTLGPATFSATAQAAAMTSVTNTDNSGLFFDTNANAVQNSFAISTDQSTLATITFNPTMTVTSSNLSLSGPAVAAVTLNASVVIDGSDGSEVGVFARGSQRFPDDSSLTSFVFADTISGAPSNTYTEYDGQDSISFVLAPGTYTLFFNASSDVGIGYGGTGSVTASISGTTTELTLNAIATPEPSSFLLLAVAGTTLCGLRAFDRRFRHA